jgi:hypothetical protein
MFENINEQHSKALDDILKGLLRCPSTASGRLIQDI